MRSKEKSPLDINILNPEDLKAFLNLSKKKEEKKNIKEIRIFEM